MWDPDASKLRDHADPDFGGWPWPGRTKCRSGALAPGLVDSDVIRRQRSRQQRRYTSGY